MFQYDYQDSMAYWILPAARILRRAMNDEFARLGVTHQQWRVLLRLAREPGIFQAELAKQMTIEPPTLAAILDRMERDGWIKRQRHPTDRRRKVIHLEPRALPLWEELAAAARRVRARAAKGLSPEQLIVLRDALATVQRNLDCEDPCR